jgi:FAD/FMN-containing dehydrogenase
MAEKTEKLLLPDSVEELSSIVKQLFKSKQRFSVVYQVPDVRKDDKTLISLENLVRISPLDKTNNCLRFLAGTQVRDVLEMLANNGYSEQPFSDYRVETHVGYLFTHKAVFRSDSLFGIKAVMPDGQIMQFGSQAYASVAGYNAIELFLGTRNTIGIPVEYDFKISPNAEEYAHVGFRYTHSCEEVPVSGEERKIILSIKNVYDPINLLNTKEI